MAYSPMRITGMATGLDTDQLVKDLMKAERLPVSNMYRNKQLLEWKQTNYREMNTKLLSLRNSVFNMSLQSTFKKYNATSSNESVVKVSATGSASLTSFTLNKVTSLAKSANIRTGDGQTISRSTSVVNGKAITDAVDTNINNTFQISINGGTDFSTITLDSGKIYNKTTPGSQLSDLVSEIQSKIDAKFGAGNVLVSINNQNKIQFTSNNYPTSGAPSNNIVLQEGDTNDILKTGLNFETDQTTKQIKSSIEKINMDETIYNNIIQHRFGNSEDFGWVVNGSDKQTLLAVDNVVSTVDYNETNLLNYHISTTESDSQTVSGTEINEVTTNLGYKGSRITNSSVYVDGVQYKIVSGKDASALEDNEVLLSDDGTGKVKLTFKNNLSDGANIQIDSKVNYSAVTGKLQSELLDNEVLIEDDGTGKAKLTFKNQFDLNTQLNVDRHDFEFKTTVYDQDGNAQEKTFNIDSMTKTMNNVIGMINNDQSAKLSAFYDEATDKVVFDSKYSGNNNSEGNDILISGSFLSNVLSLTSSTDGADATFTINGLETSRKTNSFTINEVTFDLQSTSSTATSVTVSQNVEDVYKQIKEFVDLYNDTILGINNKVTEKRDRGYAPLISDEKKEMSDDEIELWETRAKSGLLNGDSILKRITSNMRKVLYDRVESVSDNNFDHLSEIGITTSINYMDNGKLVINESKLKNAIANGSDKVMELFAGKSESTDSTQKYKQNGLSTRLYDELTKAINDIISKAGSDNSLNLYDKSSLGKEISDLSLKIENLEDRLITKENSYYNRFAALESYITRMNAQSSWLSQQFSY